MNFKEILAQLKELGYTGEDIGVALPPSVEKIGKLEEAPCQVQWIGLSLPTLFCHPLGPV